MEVKRGVMSCVFVIVLITMACMVVAVTAGKLGSSSASAVTSGRPFSWKYKAMKRRDWNTFLQYLENHKPPLTLEYCSGADVIEFLKYMDQFGVTKVHVSGCCQRPIEWCLCPTKQAWRTIDALIGRLSAAYRESGGPPESNPFTERVVRIYLRQVKDSQAKVRGITYKGKKQKRARGGAGRPPLVGHD